MNLTIYGVGGDRVRVLLDEGREAGRYEMYWDGLDDQGRSLATGAYFARIVTGDFEQIRKMILVK